MTFRDFSYSQAALRPTDQPEKYYPPKQLSAELLSVHGVALSADYLRALRSYSELNGIGLFMAGCARPSEVIAWLKVNRFRRASRSQLIAA